MGGTETAPRPCPQQGVGTAVTVVLTPEHVSLSVLKHRALGPPRLPRQQLCRAPRTSYLQQAPPPPQELPLLSLICVSVFMPAPCCFVYYRFVVYFDIV